MISKIIALGAKEVLPQVCKKSSVVTPKLEKLLAKSGCELGGVRGNLAVLRQRAPYNQNVMVTHFYDLATPNPTLLKTKEVSGGVNYLPFGAGSYGHQFPEKARFLTQKADHYPSKIGEFDSISDYKTRVYDIYGNIIEKTRVTQRNKIDPTYLNPKRVSRTVREEVQNFRDNTHFLEINPTRSLNNGTSRAVVETKAGSTDYYIA